MSDVMEVKDRCPGDTADVGLKKSCGVHYDDKVTYRRGRGNIVTINKE